MTERYLLYDSGCSMCAALAREVEARSGGRLGVRSLRDPEVQAMLNRAKPGWRWEPMLLEIEGERIRVFTGLAMRMRLLQILGPARALRVARAVACFGGPVLGVDWGRRDFLRRATGALAGWIALRSLGRPAPAASAASGSLQAGTPILRRGRRLEGEERQHALERLQGLPDLRILGLKIPEEGFPVVAAYELADGNALTAASWEIEGHEIALALLFATPAEFPSDRGSTAQIESAALRFRIKGPSIQLPALSVNGGRVAIPNPDGIRVRENGIGIPFVEIESYQILQQDCCPLWVNCTAWLAMLGMYAACCAAGGAPCCANLLTVAGIAAAICAAAQSCGPCNP